jgi:two-component system, NarL family, sensor kinase
VLPNFFRLSPETPEITEKLWGFAQAAYLDNPLAERSGLTIRLNIPDDLERLAPEMELAIFRLVQECLTNIHRHSGSKTAVIRITRESD